MFNRSAYLYLVSVWVLVIFLGFLSFKVRAAFMPSMGDNLGDHKAIQNINIGGYWLSGNGADNGIFVKADSSGQIGLGTNTLGESLISLNTGDAIRFRSGTNPIDLYSSGTGINHRLNITSRLNAKGYYLEAGRIYGTTEDRLIIIPGPAIYSPEGASTQRGLSFRNFRETGISWGIADMSLYASSGGSPARISFYVTAYNSGSMGIPHVGTRTLRVDGYIDVQSICINPNQCFSNWSDFAEAVF